MSIDKTQRLSTLKPKETAVIFKLEQGNPSYRQRLLAMGMLPGVEIEVIRKAPLGDPIEVRVNHVSSSFSVTLRKEESDIVILANKSCR